MTDLTIQGYKFEVPDAVVAFNIGYVLSEEGEVHALRQTKLENLRNNFAGAVKAALNGAESLTEAQLAELQGKFTEYATAYKFGVRQAGVTRTRVDPLTREMLNLAAADFRKAYQAKYNEKPEKELVAERAEQLIEKRNDEYRKRAQAILRQRNAAEGTTLEAMGF